VQNISNFLSKMISCNEATNYVSSINLKLTNYLAGLISRASLKRPDGQMPETSRD